MESRLLLSVGSVILNRAVPALNLFSWQFADAHGEMSVMTECLLYLVWCWPETNWMITTGFVLFFCTFNSLDPLLCWIKYKRWFCETKKNHHIALEIYNLKKNYFSKAMGKKKLWIVWMLWRNVFLPNELQFLLTNKSNHLQPMVDKQRYYKANLARPVSYVWITVATCAEV